MNQVDYVSLHDALTGGASVGALASAIEKAGIWTWDRFGRFKLCAQDSPDTAHALDRLSLHYARANDPGDERDDGFEFDSENDRLVLFGWPAGEVPEFQEPQQVKPKSPRRQAIAREENNTLRLLEGVKRILFGELTESAHPECPNEAALIALLRNHSDGREGLKEATVKAKLKAAAETWDLT